MAEGEGGGGGGGGGAKTCSQLTKPTLNYITNVQDSAVIGTLSPQDGRLLLR
jgi:hypothetical protein